MFKGDERRVVIRNSDDFGAAIAIDIAGCELPTRRQFIVLVSDGKQLLPSDPIHGAQVGVATAIPKARKHDFRAAIIGEVNDDRAQDRGRLWKDCAAIPLPQ